MYANHCGCKIHDCLCAALQTAFVVMLVGTGSA